MKAAIIEEFGSAEVIKIIETKLKPLLPGEVRVRHKALGLNYIDVYYRKGIYPAELPAILGFEACGVIEEVSTDSGEFKIGDRVAYVTAPMGCYCEVRNIQHQFLIPVPDGISETQAAGVIFKGMTAHFLLRSVFFVKPGMAILVHAAAGGVGHFLVQMAKYYQAIVIGTVGSDEKMQVAKELGCDYVINYTREDIAKKVAEITKNKGVAVVYDAIGKNSFQASLDSLQLFGMMVSYGQASGDVPEFNIRKLTEKSLFITRPTIFKYNNNREDLLASAREVFQMLLDGHIKDNIKQIYDFDEIVKAHHDL